MSFLVGCRNKIENEIADAQRCQKDLENGWQRPAPCLFRVDNQRERARRQGAIDPLIDLPVEMVWGLSLTMLLLERSYWIVSYFFIKFTKRKKCIKFNDLGFKINAIKHTAASVRTALSICFGSWQKEAETEKVTGDWTNAELKECADGKESTSIDSKKQPEFETRTRLQLVVNIAVENLHFPKVCFLLNFVQAFSCVCWIWISYL